MVLRWSILFLVLAVLCAAQVPIDYDLNCDEESLFFNHADLVVPTYDAGISSFGVAYSYFDTFVYGQEHGIEYAFLFAVNGWETALGVYQDQGATSWDVETVEGTAAWSLAFSNAHACFSGRSCCKAERSPMRARLMHVHNAVVGVQILLSWPGAIPTRAQLSAHTFQLVQNSSAWFHPLTPAAAHYCHSNTTLVYSIPAPLGIDDYESNDCSQVAAYIEPNSVQIHSFHNQKDVDWIYFCVASGQQYTVQVSSTGDQASPFAQVFQGLDIESVGQTTTDFTWTSTRNGVAFVRISNQLQVSDPYGAGYTIGVSGASHSNCTTNDDPFLVQIEEVFVPSIVEECTYPVCNGTKTNALPYGPYYSNRYGFSLANEDYLQYTVTLLKNGTETPYNYKLGIIDLTEYEADQANPECAYANGHPFTEQITVQEGTGLIPHNVNLTSTLSNCATLKLNTWLYDNAALLDFAGIAFDVVSNSFKFTIEVHNWPFQNVDNFLKILISVDTTISISQHSMELDEDLNMERAVITGKDGSTWTIRLLPVALIDGVPKPVLRRLIPGDLGTNGFTAQLELTFPYFEHSLVYDPDFFVLFGGESPEYATPTSEGGDTKTGDVVGKIEGFISDELFGMNSLVLMSVGAVAFIAVTVAITGCIIFAVRKRRFTGRLMKRAEVQSNID